jgi:hypothetical protein
MTATLAERLREAQSLVSQTGSAMRSVWRKAPTDNSKAPLTTIERVSTSLTVITRTAAEMGMVLAKDPGDEGTVTTWAPIFEEHPGTWRMLLDNEENILAYWHVAPLQDEHYAALKVGKLKAGHVRREILTPFDHEGGIYNVFFVIAGRNPGPDEPFKRQISYAIAHSYFDALEALAENEVFVREITADVWTPMGRSLANRYGMRKIGHRDRNVAIYSGEVGSILAGRGARFRPDLTARYAEQGLLTVSKPAALDWLLTWRLGMSRVAGIVAAIAVARSVTDFSGLHWNSLLAGAIALAAYKLVRISWDTVLERLLLNRLARQQSRLLPVTAAN